MSIRQLGVGLGLAWAPGGGSSGNSSQPKLGWGLGQLWPYLDHEEQVAEMVE